MGTTAPVSIDLLGTRLYDESDTLDIATVGSNLRRSEFASPLPTLVLSAQNPPSRGIEEHVVVASREASNRVRETTPNGQASPAAYPHRAREVMSLAARGMIVRQSPRHQDTFSPWLVFPPPLKLIRASDLAWAPALGYPASARSLPAGTWANVILVEEDVADAPLADESSRAGRLARELITSLATNTVNGFVQRGFYAGWSPYAIVLAHRAIVHALSSIPASLIPADGGVTSSRTLILGNAVDIEKRVLPLESGSWYHNPDIAKRLGPKGQAGAAGVEQLADLCTIRFTLRPVQVELPRAMTLRSRIDHILDGRSSRPGPIADMLASTTSYSGVAPVGFTLDEAPMRDAHAFGTDGDVLDVTGDAAGSIEGLLSHFVDGFETPEDELGSEE